MRWDRPKWNGGNPAFSNISLSNFDVLYKQMAALNDGNSLPFLLSTLRKIESDLPICENRSRDPVFDPAGSQL